MAAKIKVSEMSGKLKGFKSINTNPLTNNFCQKMSKVKDSICSQCYAISMLKTFRQNCEKPWQENSEVLSSGVLPLDELPTIKGDYLRFSSYGDLINESHLENFLNIARVNPATTCVLWTKRKDMIADYKGSFPSNLILIYSTPKVDVLKPEVPKGFHKVFSNYTPEFIDDNKLKMNCVGKCANCLLCYKKNKVKFIKEKIK